MTHFIQGDSRYLPLPDESVNLVMTSPPYADARKKTYGGVTPDKYVEWFLPIGAELYRVLRLDGSFVLNIKEKVVDGERHTYVLDLIKALRAQGWRWTEEYMWHKKNAAPGYWPNRFRDAWERCLHFTKVKHFYMNQKAVMQPVGDWHGPRLQRINGPMANPNDLVRRKSASGSLVGRCMANVAGRTEVLPTNVLHLAPEATNVGHSAAYPVSLPTFFIKLFCPPTGIVLDPFGGSGTTAVAADALDRDCVSVELKWDYIPLAKARLPRREPSLFGSAVPA